MQVAGEADDVAHHLVGDHVGEQPAHVGQRAGMLDQLGEDVMLQAGGRRLHPAQPAGGGQQRRRDLAEEGVGVGHGGERLGLVRGVDHRIAPGRGLIFSRRAGSTGGWMTSFMGFSPVCLCASLACGADPASQSPAFRCPTLLCVLGFNRYRSVRHPRLYRMRKEA